MSDSQLKEERALKCPWCDSDCMYLEIDDENISFEDGSAFRIGAYCDEWLNASEEARKSGDPSGNRCGRTNWGDSLEEAISDWNHCVSNGKKVNYKNIW